MRARLAPTLTLIGALCALETGGCQRATVVPLVSGGDDMMTPPRIRLTKIDKVDLLLVVDNSPSMGDKQRELARRLPAFVKQLTHPDIDPATGKPKYRAAADLHVAVVSSSLGSFGTSACDAKTKGAHENDHGHLLPRAGEIAAVGYYAETDDAKTPTPDLCPTSVGASSLHWVNDATRDPAAAHVGAPGSNELQVASSCVIETVGEDGCGYEQPWEAMYHFLVDPTPYAKAEAACTFGDKGDDCTSGGKPNPIQVTGIDDELLKERNAFLRPDSLLAVVIVSDENDASLKPAQLNWLPFGYGAGQMQRGWAACADVPDAFEPETTSEYNELHEKYRCKSCFEDTSDPNCSVRWAIDPRNADPDAPSLRAFAMTQRFGYNFLWSRQRYVNAFKSQVVPGIDATGAHVDMANPVFAGGFRSPDLLVVGGIVGVPGKLVGDAAAADPYTFRPKKLTEADWDKIISADLSKRDPRMIESIAPRTKYGILGYAGDRAIDAVNGGDRDVPTGDDLQYACIGPRDVDTPKGDCGSDAAKNPLCDASGKQPYFKAYPGLRHARILHDLGASAFLGSICNDSYAPILQGIRDKLQSAMNSQCFRTLLIASSDGQVDCQILEVFTAPLSAKATRCETIGDGYCTVGAEPCRAAGSVFPILSPIDAARQLNLAVTVVGADGIATQEKVQAQSDGTNVTVTGSDGVRHLVCETRQLVGHDVDPATSNACLNDPSFELPAGRGGWCYATSRAVVGDACASIGAVGTLRWLGDVQPKDGSEVFPLCSGRSPSPG